MKVPVYVPRGVCDEVTSLLLGVSGIHDGYETFLTNAEREQSEVEQEIERLNREGEMDAADQLRGELSELKRRRDHYKQEVDCLNRLLFDDRMKAVYEALQEHICEPQKQKDFIFSAWTARLDYSIYRKQLNAVTELNKKIGKAAGKLAGLLREIGEVGYDNWPSEFFSPRSLLSKTDYHGTRSGNSELWRGLRHLITGDRADRLSQSSLRIDDSLKTDKIVLVPVSPGDKQAELNPEEQLRNTINYAWEVAPGLVDLLDTVTRVSDNFQPTEQGTIGAGIRSRQTSRAQNKEFLRGWAHKLIQCYQFELSHEIKKIMASLASVVLNDDQFDVSYDDVVKALQDS